VKRAPVRDVRDTVHGNRVAIRLVKHASERAQKVIGFVHNPDSDALLLLNMTTELLVRRGARDRCLVVISAAERSCLDAFRYIYSQVHADFKKAVVVFGDGSAEMLSDSRE
jgi:hypothetical protein